MRKLYDVILENQEINNFNKIYHELTLQLSNLKQSMEDEYKNLSFVCIDSEVDTYGITFNLDNELDITYGKKIKNLYMLYLQSKIKEIEAYFNSKGIQIE